MKLPRSHFLPPSARRRLCSGLVLCAYLATIFGYPLPASSQSSADSSGATHECGCSAAAQRSGDCCCAARSSCPACVTPSVAPTKKKSCCESPQQPVPTKPVGSSTAPVGVKWVLGIAAQKCQGLSTLWITTGAAIPPAPPLSWNPPVNFLCWLSWPDTSICRLPVAPPEPPPRLY
jgi:hypothetical protein